MGSRPLRRSAPPRRPARAAATDSSRLHRGSRRAGIVRRAGYGEACSVGDSLPTETSRSSEQPVAGADSYCPTGPLIVTFSTPVRGSQVLRSVSLRPAVEFRVSDTADARTSWALEAQLKARTGYVVLADPTLRDAFGQRLAGNPVATAKTTGFAPGDQLSLRTLGRGAEGRAHVRAQLRQCRHARGGDSPRFPIRWSHASSHAVSGAGTSCGPPY